MPSDATNAALVQGAAQVLGSGIDAYATANLNKKSRQFAADMYERQKTDNLDFWRMQNEYNSPEMQMQRFKAAGLNPNLIYGQGNAGNAGSISTPDVQQPQWRVPEFGNAFRGAGAALGAYFDYEIKQAQADNLRAQNTSILEDAMLKHAQRENILQSTKRSVFDLNRDSEMLNTYYDAQRENLRNLTAQTDTLLARNEREAAMNSSNLREAAERILSMRLQRANTTLEGQRLRLAIQGLRRDNTLKDLDIGLKKEGIQPHDPLWSRVLARHLDEILNKFNSSSSPRSLFQMFEPKGGSSW